MKKLHLFLFFILLIIILNILLFLLKKNIHLLNSLLIYLSLIE